MLDVVRALGFAWALVVVCRERAWWHAVAILLTIYAFALAFASGITIRSQGPLEPMYSMLLLFVGPSGMPRGPLPPLPFASAVVRWPSLVNAAMAVLLGLVTASTVARTQRVADESREAYSLRRVALPIAFVGVVEAICAAMRALPALVGEL